MTIICHGCNTANSDSAEFCKQCGTLMRRTKKTEVPMLVPAAPEAALASALMPAAEVPCPQCAHANSPAARFCKSCGGSVVAATKLADDLHDDKTQKVLSAHLPATPIPHAAPLATAWPDIDDFDKLNPPQRSGNTAALALAAVVVVAGLVGGGWVWWSHRPGTEGNIDAITATRPQVALPAPVSPAAANEPQLAIVTEMKDGTTLVEPAVPPAPIVMPDKTAVANSVAQPGATGATNNAAVLAGDASRVAHQVNVAPTATVSPTTDTKPPAIASAPASASAADAAAARRNTERRAKAALAAYPPNLQNTVGPPAAYYPAAPAPAPSNLYQAPQQVVNVVSSLPAGSGTPREICSGQTNAALAACISSQCQSSRFFTHSQCSTLRRDRENADRQEQLRN